MNAEGGCGIGVAKEGSGGVGSPQN